MRRVIVAGGRGFFGSQIVAMLRARGLQPLVGSSRGRGDVQLDVEQPESLRGALQPCDVVIDAVGPFQNRSQRLIESAMEIGCDVVDLADSLDYVESVHALRGPIESAGIRVLTACSSVSTLSAHVVARCQVSHPQAVTGFLVPATRQTAVRGTAASLLASVGQSIRIRQGGTLAATTGWRDSRTFPFPPPLGARRGYLFESADAVTLPLTWPSLQEVKFFVDTNMLGLNRLFALACRQPWLRAMLERFHPYGLVVSRLLGGRHGGLGYEIESADGGTVRAALVAAEHGYRMAVIPAVLAAVALADDSFQPQGLVAPLDHVAAEELWKALADVGAEFTIE